jgi:hypothetical protein
LILAAALVSGSACITISVSSVTLIFNDELNRNIPAGVGIQLFSMIALRLATRQLSTFAGIIADVNVLPSAFLCIIVASISKSMSASANSNESF